MYHVKKFLITERIHYYLARILVTALAQPGYWLQNSYLGQYFCFHNTLIISYVFEACFSNSRADSRSLLSVDVELFPYAPQSSSCLPYSVLILLLGLLPFLS